MALFICQGCGEELATWEGKCPKCGVSETIRLSQATDKMVDRVINSKWKIIRKLGQGGMGAVYLGEQVGIGQRVALKFLKSEFSSDAEIARRFLNEAKSYARVAHPNAVTLHDFGQDDEGNLFIAMEYCEGVDLKKVIAEQGSLPMIEAVEVVLQVADVLATAHAKGVIHRDLKPENIMIRRGMRGVHAKVLDFGIARLMGEGTRLTVAGAIAGTPRYMSPEQVEGKEVDHRADIYSLGVVLFEALTGKQPFDGATIAEILRRQVVEPMPHLVEAAPALDYPELDAVIQQACAKKRDDRWPDFLTFASALSQSVPTQAHLSISPLQRTGSSISKVGSATGQVGTSTPSTSATSSGAPVWTAQDATGHTVVRDPTVQPIELKQKANGQSGASVLQQPIELAPKQRDDTGAPLKPPTSKGPYVALVLAVLVAGAFAAYAFVPGLRGGSTDGTDPKLTQRDPPPKDPNEGKPPPKDPNGTAMIPLDDAKQAMRDETARGYMGQGKTALELAKLDEAETYLKSVEADTGSFAEAKSMLERIAAIRQKLSAANRLRNAGQCDQALPLFQEVLTLNAKNPDARNGVAWCQQGTVNGTME